MKQTTKPKKVWLARVHRGDLVIKSYTTFTLSASGIIEGDVFVEKNASFHMKGIMNGTIYNEGIVKISGLFLGSIKENR